MTYSSKPTMLSLLSRILELEFGESRLQHYGLFEDSNCVSQNTATELLDGQHRFTHSLDELVGKNDANAVVLLVGDSLLHLAKSMAETGKPVYWFGSKSLMNSDINALVSFQYAGEDFWHRLILLPPMY